MYKSNFSELNNVLFSVREGNLTFKKGSNPLSDALISIKSMSVSRFDSGNDAETLGDLSQLLSSSVSRFDSGNDAETLGFLQRTALFLDDLFNQLSITESVELSELTGDDEDTDMVHFIDYNVVSRAFSDTGEAARLFMPFNEVPVFQSLSRDIKGEFVSVLRKFQYCTEEAFATVLDAINELLTVFVFFINLMFGNHLKQV